MNTTEVVEVGMITVVVLSKQEVEVQDGALNMTDGLLSNIPYF